MLKNIAKYKSASEALLEKSAKALADGDLKQSEALRKEAVEQLNIAKAWGDQLKVQQDVDNLKNEDSKETTPDKDKQADILPHTAVNGDEIVKSRPNETTKNEKETAEDKASKTLNAAYVIRYGDTNKAVQTVAADMYGDYNQKRENQQVAFNRYLKGGRLSANDESALQDIIYTPELIANEIKAGFSVNEINTNKAVQQTAALELGGYLVPEDFRMEITKRIAEPAIVRSQARVISTTRDAVEWTTLTGGDSRRTSTVQVTWVDEVNEQNIETEYKLGSVRIPVHTAMAQINVSRNLLEDSVTPVPDLIGEQFAEAISLEEDEKFLIGTGNGTPLGIMNKREGGLIAPGEGIGFVYSGHASQLTVDGIIDLVYEPDAQYWQNMQIVGNKGSFREIRKLKTVDGQLIWQPGLQKGDPGQILSYPWKMTTIMDSVAAGSYPLIIGDFKGYVIAERVGMTIERITDSQTVKGNQVAFFLRRRVGGQVVEPWRFKALKVGTQP